MRVIPAIDISQGQVVRLRQGRFEERTEYDEDPVALAVGWRDRGAQQLHVVDLDGALAGGACNAELVGALSAVDGLEVQVGGGLRDRAAVDAALDRGATRVVIGSLAAEDPEQVLAWMGELGTDRFVLALDVAFDDIGVPQIRTRGWTERSERSFSSVLERFLDAGLAHLLCTDVSRDGALRGPNLDLYGELMRRTPGLGLIASGGVRDTGDLSALESAGVPACVVGRALLEGVLVPEEAGCWRAA